MFVQHHCERSLLYITKISFVVSRLGRCSAGAIRLHRRRSPMRGRHGRGRNMVTLKSRAMATAVAGAIALSTVGLGSARAADFPYDNGSGYGPPQSYGAPPA